MNVSENRSYGKKSIFTFLSNRVGAPIAYILNILLYVSFAVIPTVILEFPYWIGAIMAIVFFSIPLVGDMLMYGVWIWTVVIAIQQPIDAISIVAFVLCALFVVPQLFSFLIMAAKAIFSRN